MIKDLSEIAEDEIERTSQEAVKVIVIEKEAEISYQKSLADSWKTKAINLQAINTDLKKAVVTEEKKNQFWKYSVIVESVVLTGVFSAIAFGFIGG
jgi:DNA polymerase elongation subunit (family B)